MKGLILAAGRGSRLLPITKKIPKCLIKVGTNTILDHQIEALKICGVSEIIMVVGYLSGKIRAHLLKKHPNLKFKFIVNKHYKKTNASYSFWLARKEILKNNIIYLNSDVFCSPGTILRIGRHNFAGVIAKGNGKLGGEEVKVITRSDGFVHSMGKHIDPRSADGEFAGIGKFDPGSVRFLLDSADMFIKRGEVNKFFADVVNHSVSEFNLKIKTLNIGASQAVDIDFPRDVRLAEKIYAKEKDKYLI